MSLEQLANLSTALGFPILIAAFVIDILRSSRDHDKEIQNTLSSRYCHFLEFTIARPELGLFDTLRPEHTRNPEPGSTAYLSKVAAISMLLTIFEDAFLLLRTSSARRRASAWHGWDSYMRYWASRADFSELWEEHLAMEYNAEFSAYIGDKVRSSRAARQMAFSARVA